MMMLSLFLSATGGSNYFPEYTLPSTVPLNAIYVAATGDDNSGNGSISNPYKTINGAINKQNPGAGDTIVVRGGTYREFNTREGEWGFRMPSGSSAQPFVMMAYPGERVILSGLRQISSTSWTPVSAGVYSTTINFKPNELIRLADYNTSNPITTKFLKQPHTRYPHDGWLRAEEVNNSTRSFRCSALTSAPNFTSGGDIFYWSNSTGATPVCNITSFNKATGWVTFENTGEAANLNMAVGDRFFLRSRPEFIDADGEWAVIPAGGGHYTIYYRPPGGTLTEMGVHEPNQQRVVRFFRSQYSYLVGFEIVGSDQFGIQVEDSSNVIIGKCVSHNHLRYGIFTIRASDIIIAQSLFSRNDAGVSVAYTERILIDKNEIGYNPGDGLLLTWNSSNISVRNNYIHHSCLLGHPDNIQTHNNVRNTSVINNVIYAGTSLMWEGASGGELIGNTIIGSWIFAINLNHVPNVTIKQNTVFGSYYGSLSMIGSNYPVYNNIFFKGNRGVVYSTRNCSGYSGDYNLVYNADGTDDIILDSPVQYSRTLDQFKSDTGQDQHSVFGNPIFTNMPSHYTRIDDAIIHNCTNTSLIVDGTVNWISAGDTIEVDFDGKGRRVQSVATNSPSGYNTVTLAAGHQLANYPLRLCFITKWDNDYSSGGVPGTLPQLNTAPQTGSPAIPISAGSQINMSQYQTGDFTGDGVRDIPAVQFE
jgi:hypothetical protein